MARIPSVKAFTGTSVEVLNAIRNSASTSYRDFVPFAQADSESVKKIGAIIMQYPALQNEFLNNLINRIGLVIVTNKLYSNPWRMFKKGILEMGESIEEIFVNIAKVSQFDPSVAEETVFQRQIPDVRATFHIMNYQKFYKDTISDDQLRQAFVSWDGVTDLIARIVNSMYTAAEYDEFLVMRYMLARMILDNNLYLAMPSADLSDLSPAEYNKAVSTLIKGTSNNFTFLSSKYNSAGVMTHTDKSNQYLITTVDFDANLDVESLAFAFNMDKIQFAGNRVLVPSFGFDDSEIARLNDIFQANPNLAVIGPIDNNILKSIEWVLVSGDFFRVYDNLIKFTEIYNSEGLYWNYSLHTWKTFSTSPFENGVFYSNDQTIQRLSVGMANLNPTYTGVYSSEYKTLTITASYTLPGGGGIMPDFYTAIRPIGPVATIPGGNEIKFETVPGTNVSSTSATFVYNMPYQVIGGNITVDFDTAYGHKTLTVRGDD